MQLVAYGAQDIYLTGNPQITFFKVVYRRHTNFSMETIQQTINGTSSTGASATNGTVTISRNGDLVSGVCVHATNTTLATPITNGSQIVNEVKVEIGGQQIDKQNQEWMDVWNELNTTDSKALGLKSMQGDIGNVGTTGAPNMVQIPLLFWFCRNPGLALPLIALQYHEVKLQFTWGTNALVGGTGASCSVYCDYIYLDTDERRRFAQVSHEYLIEQVQRNQPGAGATALTLNFNHPVKELIWTQTPANAALMDVGTPITTLLSLNGHDRFAAQNSEYFRLRQPYQYHTAVPRQNLPSAAQTSLLDRQIQLVELNNVAGAAIGALTEHTFAGVNGDVTGECHWANGVNSNRIDFGDADMTNAAFAAQVTVGTQLAVVCTVQSSGGAAVSTAGTMYFGTITATPTTATGVLTFSATPFVSADATALTIGTGAVVGAGGQAGRYRVFRVTNGNSAQARTSQMTNAINVYSFGLKPEEHQPSGTCNFSRIDNSQLKFSASATVASIYAVNYNVLRIMSGMGGLAYSN